MLATDRGLYCTAYHPYDIHNQSIGYRAAISTPDLVWDALTILEEETGKFYAFEVDAMAVYF